jgi:hypothetical protein
MAVTPVSSLALALSDAETLLAASTTFQTKTGKNAAGVKDDHIFYGDVNVSENSFPGDKLPDFLVVIAEDAHGYLQLGQSSTVQMGGTGGVFVLFRCKPEKADPKDSRLSFLNWAAGVMDDVAGEIGSGAHFPFNRITMVEPPYRPDITTRASEDFWIMAYTLHYSVEG